jgi:altronate dehydratase small subunit
MSKAIKLNEKDNVATVFSDASKGDILEILTDKGTSWELDVLNDIPYGHKIALSDIKVGQQVTKYGEEIGIASKPIKAGDYVHIHNIESIRGRGDWDENKKSKITTEMVK